MKRLITDQIWVLWQAVSMFIAPVSYCGDRLYVGAVSGNCKNYLFTLLHLFQISGGYLTETEFLPKNIETSLNDQRVNFDFVFCYLTIYFTCQVLCGRQD